MRYVTTTLFLMTTMTLACPLAMANDADDDGVTSRGGIALSAGGALSSSGFSLGGSFGYFVSDNVLPGVRYYYSLTKYDDPYFYKAQYHDISVFLRYYLPHLERVYPFLVAEPGYHLYTVTQTYATGEDTTETSTSDGSYYTAYTGVGAVLMLTNHLGIEPNLGLKEVIGDGEGPVVDWWVGLGLYP